MCITTDTLLKLLGGTAAGHAILYSLDKGFHDALANLHPHTLFLEHVQKW